jgi:hypothetical protein
VVAWAFWAPFENDRAKVRDRGELGSSVAIARMMIVEPRDAPALGLIGGDGG